MELKCHELRGVVRDQGDPAKKKNEEEPDEGGLSQKSKKKGG